MPSMEWVFNTLVMFSIRITILFSPAFELPWLFNNDKSAEPELAEPLLRVHSYHRDPARCGFLPLPLHRG